MHKEVLLKIALGNNRKDVDWKNRLLNWQQFCQKCSYTIRTAERLEEYLAMPKSEQGKIKDKGGFVGGELSDGHRKASHVLNWCMVVFDLDEATPEFVAGINELVPYGGLYYSTHKHRPEKPRIRLVIPTTRAMNLDEFTAVSRLVAQEMGVLSMLDACSFQPQQMMYWPTTAKDGEYLFGVIDKEFLNPDVLLRQHPGWQDFSTLPRLPAEKVIKRLSRGKAMDPLQKFGAHGAFNRVFDIHAAIERFLPTVYLPTRFEDRYTYAQGECTAGLVVYDHGNYAYSHHSHDPANGRLLDAYDLVRTHLFQDMGDRKSQEAMFKMICELPELKLEFIRMHEAQREKAAQAAAASKGNPIAAVPASENLAGTEDNKSASAMPVAAEADTQEWQLQLSYNKQGKLENSLQNAATIIANDPKLKDIVYNELSGFVEVQGQVPWYHPLKGWRDQDDAQLMMYLDTHYGTFSPTVYATAFTKVADDRHFHPIKDYFAKLPQWDGVPRVDRLLVDYLGAEDNEYVRAVTRKTLCGAAMRILHPGCKFDYMLVLNGPQGVGKSTLISKLGGQWFSDSLSMADTRDKTAAEKLQGYWILEIGELAGMNKMDVETLRSFISRQNDIFRAAYGRQTTEHPRQCIFIGTTNAYDGYLRDTTGNRRFWPVKVTGQGAKKTWDITREEVGQIWAEALGYVEAGESLYLSHEINEMAKKEQQEAMESDDRIGLVEQFLAKKLPENWKDKSLLQRQSYFRDNLAGIQGTVERTEVCTYEIWCECLGHNKSDLRKIDSYQITAILEKLGWERKGKRRTKLYGIQQMFEAT